MYSASPREGERFFLRLLLLHVRGPTSYEELRSVDGELLPSFREACIRRHLLADDNVWEATLREAAAFQMPRQLRQMFATICAHGAPSNPLALYNAFKAALCEDFSRTQDQQTSDNLALLDIQEVLIQSGM
jgi:cobalamin biosynthesis Co2+ chelatase CbiK